MFSSRAMDPDVCFGECVLKYDAEVYSMVFGDLATIWNTPSNQIDTGEPGIRNRLISTMLSKRWRACMEPGSQEFKNFFYRKCMLLGDAFFRAPDDAIRAYAAELAKNRKMSQKYRSGNWQQYELSAKGVNHHNGWHWHWFCKYKIEISKMLKKNIENLCASEDK